MAEHRIRVYIEDGKEHLEVSRCDTPVEMTAPFPDNLLKLLYLDTEVVKLIAADAEESLRQFYMTKQSEYKDAVLASLEKLSTIHPYYLSLLLDWEKRFQRAEETDYIHIQNDLPYKQLQKLAPQLSRMQDQISAMFGNVLDIDKAPATLTVPERYTKFTLEHQSSIPDISLTVTIQPTRSNPLTMVLTPSDPDEITTLTMLELLKQEQRVRVCKNCGRYFALTGRANAEYCTRIVKGSGKTCREVGAVRCWEQKQGEDEVFKAYRKEYKRRFAWIRLRKITAEMFYAWSEEARKKKAACERGEMTMEEFEEWLKMPMPTRNL